jgi:hypothetical protein
MRLVDVLLDRGWLSPLKLRSLAGYQNLEDEQLGVGLLEEGLITADQLASALGILHGVPPALDQDYARIDQNLLKRLSAHRAANLKAIPLYTSPSRRVAVAMVNPTDLKAIDELSFALGAAIEPMVTSEPTLARHLELLYNMPRRWTTAYHPVASPSVSEKVAEEARRAMNALPLVANAGPSYEMQTPGPPVLPQRNGPRRHRKETLSYVQAVNDLPLFVPADANAPVQSASDAASRTPIPPHVAVTGPDAAVEQILAASDRQAAADQLFAFMRACFGAGAMFVVNGLFAEGRFGYNEGAECPALEKVIFSLSLPSCFRDVFSKQAVFHGVPSIDGEPVHRTVWTALGSRPPREIVVAPVVVHEQCALLLYAQGRGGGRVEHFATGRLGRVCTALAKTLLRLAS